jgi:hypothetical protein
VKTNNRLPGHELMWEGKLNPNFHRHAYEWNGPGKTRCSCGHPSPHLPSTAARKRWHREHKDEIRAGRTGAQP